MVGAAVYRFMAIASYLIGFAVWLASEQSKEQAPTFLVASAAYFAVNAWGHRLEYIAKKGAHRCG